MILKSNRFVVSCLYMTACGKRNCHQTGFCQIPNFLFLLKFHKTFQFSYKLTKITDTLFEDLCVQGTRCEVSFVPPCIYKLSLWLSLWLRQTVICVRHVLRPKKQLSTKHHWLQMINCTSNEREGSVVNQHN